jgi:hypothetical protein
VSSSNYCFTDTLYKISIVRAPLFGSAPTEDIMPSAPKALLSKKASTDSSKDLRPLLDNNEHTQPQQISLFTDYALSSSALSSACASPVDHIVGDYLSRFQELSVLASTESEALFMLDSSSLSSNLVISNNNLTLRNATNKKWSTARGAVKMCSGLHKWDIHIDR